MAVPDHAGDGIAWYDPDPRGIIHLDSDGLIVSRSLRQRVRNQRFRVTTDTAFSEVIRACAHPRGDEGEWIDARIIDAYERLFAAGHAHSIEAWLDCTDGTTVLVGGLYGVHLRGLFAGESMFSRPRLGGTDASKVCLVHLWHHLCARGFTLLDTQFTNEHIASLGGVEIPREAYHQKLGAALQISTAWGELAVPMV